MCKDTHAHTYILLGFDLLVFCGILCGCLWKISCVSDFGVSVMVACLKRSWEVFPPLLLSEGGCVELVLFLKCLVEFILETIQIFLSHGAFDYKICFSNEYSVFQAIYLFLGKCQMLLFFKD